MGRSEISVAQDERNITRVPVNQGVAGTTTLLAAVAGKRHKVVGAILTMSADGTMLFAGSTSGGLTGPLDVAQRGGLVANGLLGLIVTGVAEDLQLITTLGAARGVVAVLTE